MWDRWNLSLRQPTPYDFVVILGISYADIFVEIPQTFPSFHDHYIFSLLTKFSTYLIISFTSTHILEQFYCMVIKTKFNKINFLLVHIYLFILIFFCFKFKEKNYIKFQKYICKFIYKKSK